MIFKKNITVGLITLTCFFCYGCACTQKYNHLQNQYTEVQVQKRTEQDNYKREIKEKDEQIAELLRYIKNLESRIKELEKK